MKHHLITAALLIWVTLFVAASSAYAQEEGATAHEIKEAQETARHFVARLQQTRDVAALFDELFLPDFISHFISEEGVYPPLYSRLSRTERQRLFAVMYSLHYLSAVAIISDHDDMKVIYGERESKPKMLLPHSTALKLSRALRQLGGKTELKSYQQFRVFLPAMEKALAEVRAYLKRRGIEQTPAFQRELAPNDKSDTGINYRVRTYTGGQNVKACGPLVGFPEKQKFFRVELPLLIGAILIKDGERMKIVRLTYVDGD